MNVREKLVELLGESEEWAYHKCDESDCITCPAGKMIGNCVHRLMADRLIAHGVTLQEWISVDDRLPEAGGYVVCIAKRNPFSRFMPMVARIEKNGWANPITEQYISEVTHWMPIPQPPKGE